LGKTARTTRTVSAGISGIGCGFIDIVGLLHCVWGIQLSLYFIKKGALGFRHQYQRGEEPQLHYQKQMDTFVDTCNNGLMLRSFTIVIFMDDYLFLVEWCSVQKWRGAIQVNRASPNT
jgi:hypothetical protein